MIFEKIRERLKLATRDFLDGAGSITFATSAIPTNRALDIINQVEAEYKDGWISCSERLPEDNEMVIFTAEEGVVDAGQYEAKTNWCVNDSYFPNAFDFIAWQPLPEPYIPKADKPTETDWKLQMMNHFTKGE